MPSLFTASVAASLVGAIVVAALLRRWRRHGFHFSLRTSLIVITVASLALAAFMQWGWPRLEHVRAVYRIRAVGGSLYFEDEEGWDGTPSDAWGDVGDIWFGNDAEFSAVIPSLQSLRQLDGITLGRSTTNASLAELARLNLRGELSLLQLQSSQITDLTPLKEIAALPYLFINTASLTDQGLQALPEIRGLERLFILEEGSSANPARFGGRGFGAIASMPELKYLTLANLEITSESAAHLYALKNLRELRIHRCLIDTSDVAALREALPHCEIKFSERPTP